MVFSRPFSQKVPPQMFDRNMPLKWVITITEYNLKKLLSFILFDIMYYLSVSENS